MLFSRLFPFLWPDTDVHVHETTLCEARGSDMLGLRSEDPRETLDQASVVHARVVRLYTHMANSQQGRSVRFLNQRRVCTSRYAIVRRGLLDMRDTTSSF